MEDSLYDVDGLPNPQADLDWGGFKGAIHDIFGDNAKKHPERLCVVETESEGSPERRFSYSQINQAANILSNYLVQDGIKRGDVVMVYAYRGVDLVVAVMGVLRAGATFSVIDPSYPPERQKIYLEVAQPKALINIRKATQEAGQLSQLVRTYIDSELRLKTEVPSLHINDHGSLSGGDSGGQDIFDAFRDHVDEGPNILIGPDSNPTLSFTSGSEGRPKGVLGRHFSLTYYFPWMAKKFQLSENDKFTMLSGIAHDPIQRDIFTPLFLGAQLLVPAKEDIQHEQLAIWMQKYEPTVTHLTPAMGQVLVGGSTAKFPSLRRAFFVGDVLTKRDCSLLQELSQNVRIINMLGTTETQRAVSYFEIPSRLESPDFLATLKDTVPAGRGMLNVQLIVVDREDKSRRCGVGEPGEIYFRAAGLAERYLRNDALNKEKFVANWFTQRSWQDEYRIDLKGKPAPSWADLYYGPRDRMYRTGDLGQYLPNGDVECTGRADDQTKIRGYRVELGDINSSLSRHKLVRDSVTLVRRNKDEEPRLVTYIIPEFNAWSTWLAQQGLEDVPSDDSMVGMLRRFKPLQNSLREHLKTRFKHHEIPTHFIPMLKLPLNPNGKVDKPALPFPDVADLTAARDIDPRAWESLSEGEKTMAGIWAELISGYDPRMISPTDSFFDLGGHSILAQQMLLRIRRQVPGTRPTMAALFKDPSLRGFTKSLDKNGPVENGTSHVNGSTPTTTNGTLERSPPIQAEYSQDARQLAIGALPKSFISWRSLEQPGNPTVFLTGASGYLGAFLLRDLLARDSPQVKVIAHVRAESPASALQRLQQTCTAYGIWQDQWIDRLTCVTGNLSQPRLGIDDNTWAALVREVDVVIHNGAQVHWVSSYSHLKPVNVMATLEALQLCTSGRPKRFAFISSTSVLDTEHYVRLSEELVQQGMRGISEADDLEGSSVGLGNGYGQTKWASEYLVREAGIRGLSGVIVRPGYVLGDSSSGGVSCTSIESHSLLTFANSCEHGRLFDSDAQGLYPAFRRAADQ